MLSKLISLALAATPLGMPVDGGPDNAPASLTAPPTVTVDSDELLLFAVQLDNSTLTESLTAYGDPSDPLVPVGELSRLLDLALDIQPRNGLITGRIGESQRPITIDLTSGQALVGGRVIALAPPGSKVTGSDIYLRASLLSKLLPVTIRASADELLLDLTAREKLPIQARRERSSRIRGLMDAPEIGDDVLIVPTPYQWAGMPSFDFGIELGADSTLKHAVTRFEGRFAADLAKTGVVGWIATDDVGNPSSARLTASRRSAEGDLLGPLRATSAAAGDVYAPALALGPRSIGGAGVQLSSQRQEQASVFQRIDLRGELPIGYDIELYVNDVLRSGQEGAKTQGRYEFNNVPLVRGRNVIRLVLYGPRGDRSEQTRIINVGGGQLAAGQTTFDAGVVVQDRPLIGLTRDNTVDGNLAKGSLRAVINLAHGITPGLTLSGGAASYEDFGGQRHLVLNTGFRTSLAGLAVQGDIAKDLKDGSAASLGLAGRLGGIGFLARHVEYSGNFNDEANIVWDAARPMRRYDEVTLDFALRLGGRASLPVSARIDRAQFTDGGTMFSARARTSATVAGTLLALGGDYNRRTGPGGKSEDFTANLSASRFVAYKWQLRATADFRLLPSAKLETLGVTADRAISDRYSIRFGASRSFSARDVTLQTGLTARLPFADATLGGDWSTQQKRWRVGLQLNFGLAWDPLKRGYRSTPPGPANGGSASLLAFIDANANGRPDAGEAPVSGIELQGAGRKLMTDKDGRAFVTGLGESSSASLRADISNADTGFIASPPQTIMFAPRAGHVATVYYPLVPTSELAVKLDFRQQDGTMIGLSAVRLRLVPQSGPAMEGVTEFDGTVVFDAVKPGTYRLELDPVQAGRLGMRLTAPMTVRIGADGSSQRLGGEIAFARSNP